MYTLVVVLLVITSILLGLIVLVQNSKGGGLASGLSASNQVMGVRKTTDWLEKLTWGFALTLLALAIVGNLALPKGQSTTNQSLIQDQIDKSANPTQQAPAAPAPGNTAQPAGQPAAQPAQPQPAPAGGTK